MNKTLWTACIAASVALTACQTSGPVSAPRSSGASSSQTDAQSIRRAQAAYQSLVAKGKSYHFAGQLSDMNVGTIDGVMHIVAHAAPGDYLNVSFITSPHDLFDIAPPGGRSLRSLPIGCDDCGGSGGGAATPPPSTATSPPNRGGCDAAGGATWFDESTGNGGCLGPGGSKGLPCGIWAFSSPGHGRYRSYDGLVDADGFTYISVNPDGESCHLGNK